MPDLGELSAGEVGGFAIDEAGGFTVLACRVGDQLYAYRDHCPACERSLAGAALHRVLGNVDAVLRCPQCHAHFDVVHAGACVDRDADCHLEPLPLLIRDGALSIAVPARSAGGLHMTSPYDVLSRITAPGKPPSRRASDARCAPKRSPTSTSMW